MRPWSAFLSFTLVLLLEVAAARKCPARHYSLAAGGAGAQQDKSTQKNTTNTPANNTPSFNGCFPSRGFTMPSSVPSSTQGWWCDQKTEYAFMGFSYAVAGCQSLSTLKREFKDVKNTFGGRYVRLYGACDRKGFYDDVIEAAWEAGIGVHALIWFGWDDPNIWKRRRDTLFGTLHSNPKAKFVTRVVQFGSEPLYDHALPADTLAAEVRAAKENLRPLGIPVTVSDMAYGFQQRGSGGKAVMNAIDFIDAHTLPFFSTRATTGAAAWPIVKTDLDYFIANGGGKKIYLSQNGWPSVQYSGVRANSAAAVSNVDNERAYFDMLDSQCSYFKTAPNGIGWFAHIYSDSQAPGYGIYGTDGRLKFRFAPKTSC